MSNVMSAVMRWKRNNQSDDDAFREILDLTDSVKQQFIGRYRSNKYIRQLYSEDEIGGLVWEKVFDASKRFQYREDMTVERNEGRFFSLLRKSVKDLMNEIIEEFGGNKKYYRAKRDLNKQISLNTIVGDDGVGELQDLLESEYGFSSPLQNLEMKEMITLYQQLVLNKLGHIALNILQMKLRGMTFGKMSQELGIKEDEVSSIFHNKVKPLLASAAA